MPDTRIANLTEQAATTQERRRQSRVIISTPVRIRTVAGSGQGSEESTTTLNLSSTGILIETANPAYYRSMKVAVTLPYSESDDSLQAEQEGNVVRVSELVDGRRSVAIALTSAIFYENVSATTDKPDRETLESGSGKLRARRIPTLVLPLVLVLAEESDSRQSIKAYLSGEGYEVITVSNAAEARGVLNECTPALVISEIEGEGMPGYDLCAHCKQTPRLKIVPVLLMTSSAYPSDYARAHSLGAVVCMAKPYKRERLGHVVRLLAPPPNANNATPPRVGDKSRRAGGNRSKGGSSVTVRRFRFHRPLWAIESPF